MSGRCRLIYDGTEISDYCDVVDIKFSAMPSLTLEVQKVPGRGDVRIGRQMEPLDIPVTLRLNAGSLCPIDVKDKWAVVAAHLFKDGARALSFGDDRYWLAEVVGATEIDQHAYYGDVTVTFRCLDPVSYRKRSVASAPSGKPVDFVVGGSYPVRPSIFASNVRADGSTGLWSIRLDDKESLCFELTTGVHEISIDCGTRVCWVDGATALPTLGSDWWVLDPGGHIASVDMGTGVVSIDFRERWL